MADKEWSVRSRINGYAASGTTSPLETSVLDMNGFDSVMFVGLASVTNTGQYLSFQMGTASTTGAANFSEATGNVEQTVTGAIVMDVFEPTKRFVQGRFTASGASAPARGLLAIRYGARSLPTTQDAGSLVGRFYSPGSGTATG